MDERIVLIARDKAFRKFISKSWNLFCNGLLPGFCIYCDGNRGKGGDFLCKECRESIQFLNDALCYTCGAPADISYDYPREDFQCGLCRKKPFSFDKARSLGRYDTVLKELIHFFKYRPQRGAVSEIEFLIESFFPYDREELKGFSVLPIPLYKNKLQERQFDQAYLIANVIADRFEMPMGKEWLVKVRDTEPQAKKTKTERVKNVRGAFETTDNKALACKDLILVDDVFTTGATVNEASRILKKSKCGRVYVFTLARA